MLCFIILNNTSYVSPDGALLDLVQRVRVRQQLGDRLEHPPHDRVVDVLAGRIQQAHAFLERGLQQVYRMLFEKKSQEIKI